MWLGRLLFPSDAPHQRTGHPLAPVAAILYLEGAWADELLEDSYLKHWVLPGRQCVWSLHGSRNPEFCGFIV